MPFIIYLALAIALVLIGASIAYTIPEVPHVAVAPAAGVAKAFLAPLGWFAGIAVLAVSALWSLRRRL